MRRGDYEGAVAVLEAALGDVRKLRMDGYAEFTEALIAEAQAFGGEPIEALDIAGRALEANDRLRPLLTRAAGIALARMGQKEAALRELTHSLRTAQERGAEYDIAAAIDLIEALDGADRQMLSDRDEILERLKIEHLPKPALPV
jgi:tetratricopeptide (TPR) repeat protein